MNAKIQHFSFLLALALALFAVLPAQATTYDWTGTTSAVMNVTTNWSTSVVPTGTDIARWNAASYTTNATVSVSQTIGELLFDSGNTNALSLGAGSQTLTLNGVSNGSSMIGIQMNSGSGAVTTSSAKFKLGASQTWLNNSSSLLTVAGIIGGAANVTPYTLTIDGTGNTTLTGIISNGGAIGTTAITKIGTGTLTLGGGNTFTGGLNVNSGTVICTTPPASFGNGTITLGDTTGSSSATLLHLSSNAGNYSNAITVRAGSSGTLSINAQLGNAIFSGTVTLNNALSLAELTAAKTLTLNNTITGGSDITIGSGNLGAVALTGANNGAFTGNITVNAGTLNFGSGGLGNGSGTITLAGGTLQYAAAANVDDVSARLRTSGSNTLNIDMNNNAVTFGANLTAASIAGSGGLTLTSSTPGGTLTLSGANTYTGGTTLTNGTLNINSTTALGTGTFTFTNGTIDNTSTGALTNAGNNAISLSGTAALTFGGTQDLNMGTGAVALTLPAANGTRIITLNGTGRTLTFGGAVTESSTAGTTTMQVDGAGNTLVLGSLVLNANATARSNIWSGSANITINGALTPGGIATNKLTYAGTGTMKLLGDSTYTGTTTITSGTLQFGKMASLYNGTTSSWTAAKINVASGATLAVNVDSGGTAGFDGTNLNTLLGNISVAANATSGLQSGAIIGLDTSTATGATFTQGNAIANSTGANGGAISVTKLGAGTLVFDKSNTYTGTTTVSTGTLLINGNQSSASGNVTVISGATLGGNGTVGGATTINAGATLSPGNSPGNLTFSNGLTLAGAYKWELAALSTSGPGTNFDVVTVTAGDVNITGSMNLTLGVNAPSSNVFWTSNQTWTGIVNNTGGGSLTGSFVAIDNSSWSIYGAFSTANVGNDVNLVWTAVPEPATWVLAFSGLSFVLVARRLRHRC